ncbi:hypothetical protein FCM35_KLT05283 [Carex littledalei]|uniref:Uncharacterized protein n=1 Tax=Carex littledalei TaxID=544730 RepID=A0A833V9L3_9POAL|nr:hypothetical protein FCM35_KLT05283 [Carex littledalei]
MFPDKEAKSDPKSDPDERRCEEWGRIVRFWLQFHILLLKEKKKRVGSLWEEAKTFCAQEKRKGNAATIDATEVGAAAGATVSMAFIRHRKKKKKNAASLKPNQKKGVLLLPERGEIARGEVGRFQGFCLAFGRLSPINSNHGPGICTRQRFHQQQGTTESLDKSTEKPHPLFRVFRFSIQRERRNQ